MVYLWLNLVVLSPRVTPGQPLTSLQKSGLDLVARLHGGQDVVLALDTTGSVGLNDSGRIRLTQIIKDGLKPGDSVYVIPFASNTNLPKNGIQFRNKSQIPEILNATPFQLEPTRANTDIQRAELEIYQYLAQQNQDRINKNQPIKPQSVVWITDAPLFMNSRDGCQYSSTQTWVETPARSPFRNLGSPESQLRQAWLKALCPVMDKRSLHLESYNLTVVDIAPTVQESCTPAPGGTSICLVNPYLVRQLWLPSLLLTTVLITILGGVVRFLLWQLSTKKKWQMRFTFDSQPAEDEKICYLPCNKSIGIGGYDSHCIDSVECPRSEVRAYLERQGNQLYLEPTGSAPIYWGEREITKRTRVTGNRLQLNCPDDKNLDFYIAIKISQ